MADINTLPPDPNRSEPILRSAADPVHLGEIEEESVFTTLISNFRDAFFPEKLPPLVLQSKPIAVPDVMATKMTKKSVAMSVAFYALLILLIGILIRNHVTLTAPVKQAVTLTDIKIPPKIPPAKEAIGGIRTVQ